MEARTELVSVSVFKTDVALREQRLGEFDSHAFPRAHIINLLHVSEVARPRSRSTNLSSTFFALFSALIFTPLAAEVSLQTRSTTAKFGKRHACLA
jgi:hypothetical protein